MKKLLLIVCVALYLPAFSQQPNRTSDWNNEAFVKNHKVAFRLQSLIRAGKFNELKTALAKTTLDEPEYFWQQAEDAKKQLQVAMPTDSSASFISGVPTIVYNYFYQARQNEVSLLYRLFFYFKPDRHLEILIVKIPPPGISPQGNPIQVPPVHDDFIDTQKK